MSKSLQKTFQKIFVQIADIFFPNSCFGCGKSGTLLCGHCSHRIPLLTSQVCFLCQKNITRYGERCFTCHEKDISLDAVFAATCYQVPLIKKLIHTYKYRFVTTLATPLGQLLARSVEQSALPLPSRIVAVPLHTKRLRFRGFNQSEKLAKVLEKSMPALFGIKNETVLERTRFTKPQQKTKQKEERLQNLAGAFMVNSKVSIKDDVIWLIDDVATTNSTLLECARELKNAGAKKIYAIVLARD